MPWLRAGTVAVTNGSTTVTGTNADFAANARTGDSFVGPDGLNYEVANVASATVISILPAYKGPTASGAAYAIMPVEGYSKASADAINAWRGLYGTKMAALGTTGNYDVLPVTKGGTGGTTQATARTGLGLGTSSVLAAQTSTTDTTANSLMRVGAGGILGAVYTSEMDFDLIKTPGLWSLGGGTFTNGPSGAAASRGQLHVIDCTGIYGTQVLYGQNGRTFWRKLRTTWQPWKESAEGGDNSTITSLSGLTTALSIAQGGTGAKTVAAAVTALGLDVATITNANGTAIRFPDGTQICTGYVNAPSLAIVDVRGSCFAGPYLAPPMFASAFIQPPVATMSIVGNAGLIWVTGAVAPTTTYFQGAYAMSPYSVTASAYISYMAVGRWK